MRTDLDQLYKLNLKDATQAAELLSRAFHHWPVAIELIPDEKERMNKSKYAYEMSIKYLIKHGEAYASSPNLEGVALWVHSDYNDMSLWQMIKHGALKILFRLGFQFVKDMDLYVEFMEKNTNELVKEPHYHLNWLAVEPELQETGIGTELMYAMLEKFSKEKMKCYLDTQERENVEYYRKFGFKVLRKCQYPHINATYWGLLWEPEH
jgi:ribosomal protein S18 acetylase RimI-like enzyme